MTSVNFTIRRVIANFSSQWLRKLSCNCNFDCLLSLHCSLSADSSTHSRLIAFCALQENPNIARSSCGVLIAKVFTILQFCQTSCSIQTPRMILVPALQLVTSASLKLNYSKYCHKIINTLRLIWLFVILNKIQTNKKSSLVTC
jgi:hypothetical protein